MGFNFPNAPITGQLYPVTPIPGQPQYRYDGEKWRTIVAVVGYTSVVVSDTPPAAPVDGMLWWESDTGNLYIRYNDGDSTQWVICGQFPSLTGVLRYDTAQTLSWTQQAQARANISALKKNYIVNGGMMVSQENGTTVSAIGNNTTYYAADQWLTFWQYAAGNASAANVAGVWTTGYSPNRIRFYNNANNNSPAAADATLIQQRIEGLRVADLAQGSPGAKPFAVSFGVRGPAGTYSLCLANLTSGASRRCYVTTFTIAAGEANQDVYKTFNIPGDTTATGWVYDNTIGLMMSIVLAVGSTYQTATLNAWQTNANALGWSGQTNFGSLTAATFDVFDVGLYEIIAPAAFQVPDYASELQVCRRYFRMKRLLSGAGETIAPMQAFSTTQAIGNVWPFEGSEFRSTPVGSYSAPGDFGLLDAGTTNRPITAFTVLAAQANGLYANATIGTASLTAPGISLMVAFNANAWFKLNARM